MKTKITAKTFVFGKNIDTDQIYPGRYLELVKPQDIAAHCLEGADPEFMEKMDAGGIVVAGTNFGCGSSREHAPIALLSAGVSIVLAESFARIFYRNAMNLALPLMVCPGISGQVKTGDQLQIDLEKGMVENLTTGEAIQCEKISSYALDILEAGGIKPLMRKRLGVE